MHLSHWEDRPRCLQSPCVKNGTCFSFERGGDLGEGGFSFICECPEDIMGMLCEILPDPCNSSPCMNNGTCIDLSGSFFRMCPNDFTGATCEDDFDPCASDPCMGRGTCEQEQGAVGGPEPSHQTRCLSSILVTFVCMQVSPPAMH